MNGIAYFHDQLDELHVDEKWFFLSKETLRYYITEREKDENEVVKRKCRHKNHIEKVMFLAAVARPRFDDDGNCTFDGKIGLWPFVHQVPAQRKSKNRPAGTLETKCINVKREVYTQFMYDKVLPATIAKFPLDKADCTQTVYIQQDNPNTHINLNDPEWLRVSQQDPCFKFHFKKQPANSPDTNILDLGYFRALQSSQWKQPPARNIDELIAQVNTAWEQYDPFKLNKIWLSHQAVCNCILEDEGHNNFQLPHIGKDKQERNAKLPIQLEVSECALTSFGTL